MVKVKAGTTSAVRWAGRLERLERSGLSIRRFAAREGLKAGTLSFWKWKLAQQVGRDGQAGIERAAPLQFVELRARQAPRPVPAWGFEVVLASGRMVRIAGGFDTDDLARLVSVLEETRS